MSAPDDPEARRRGGWLLLPPLAEDRSLREALTRLSCWVRRRCLVASPRASR